MSIFRHVYSQPQAPTCFIPSANYQPGCFPSKQCPCHVYKNRFGHLLSPDSLFPSAINSHPSHSKRIFCNLARTNCRADFQAPTQVHQHCQRTHEASTPTCPFNPASSATRPAATCSIQENFLQSSRAQGPPSNRLNRSFSSDI